MTKVITGEKFDTSFGTMLVPNEQDTKYKPGDTVKFKDAVYSIIGIIPPSRPDGKWSLRVKDVQDETR